MAKAKAKRKPMEQMITASIERERRLTEALIQSVYLLLAHHTR